MTELGFAVTGRKAGEGKTKGGYTPRKNLKEHHREEEK